MVHFGPNLFKIEPVKNPNMPKIVYRDKLEMSLTLLTKGLSDDLTQHLA